MALGFQARAALRVLSRMGQDALLRGAPAGKVHIARNVALFPGIINTADDNPMVRYTVASIDQSLTPKVGNTLSIGALVDGVFVPEANFVLDRLVQNNGYVSRWIVAAAP